MIRQVTAATPRSRAQLLPRREVWQMVMAELGKYGDRNRQVWRAFWGVHGLVEDLLIDHTPCEITDCVTCQHIADALCIFYAIDALTANDLLVPKGGTP